MGVLPRRFHLYRRKDVSGVSGTGRVAEGVVFPDGSACLWWRNEVPDVPKSYIHYRRIIEIHGHNLLTNLVWDDPEPSWWYQVSPEYLAPFDDARMLVLTDAS